MDIAQMIRLNVTYDVSFCVFGTICIMLRMIKRVMLGLFIFILASSSVVVAGIVGAMEGHTTDIGFLQGGMLGVVAGVINAAQLFGPVLHHDRPLSKVAILRRVVNGKAIMGMVRPFVLKAYQWQIVGLDDTSYMEISNIYDVDQNAKGLSKNSIKSIPIFYTSSSHQTKSCCPICLEDWEEGEMGRELERCGHTFHMNCIDHWLLRQETCPICRDHLSYYTCTLSNSFVVS